jgi:cellulose synthase/poly-beta-1,6-N-acetylglucosamine synthase-like glycosyltransferase
MAPKKYAVAQGIAAVDSEIIVVTDADCHVKPGWISGLVSHLAEDVGVVVGFTSYRFESGVNRLLYGVQALEFLSYDFCAAGAIGSGRPFNSNANNLAYRRAAYREVGGFASGGEYISGDDDLFLQAVAEKSGWRVDYAVEAETHVDTRPTRTVVGMIRQRMRWASKWDAYGSVITSFLVSTFVMIVGLFFLVPWGLFDPAARPLPLVAFGVKVAADYLMMSRGTRMFGIGGLMRYFPLVELVHVPLILIGAVGGQFATHEWRGRRLSRKV